MLPHHCRVKAYPKLTRWQQRFHAINVMILRKPEKEQMPIGRLDLPNADQTVWFWKSNLSA